MYKVTVGQSKTTSGDKMYGYQASKGNPMGSISPTTFENVPIRSIYRTTGFLAMSYLEFASNPTATSNIGLTQPNNAQYIKVTRLDNNYGVGFEWSSTTKDYSALGSIFKENDVGKTIDVIIEITDELYFPY